MFLKCNIRHRRAPVKSVKEAIAQAGGDLEEAERIAAHDLITISTADDEPEDSTSGQSGKTATKCKTQVEEH